MKTRKMTHAQRKDGKHALMEGHDRGAASNGFDRRIGVDAGNEKLAILLGLAQGTHVPDVAQVPTACEPNTPRKVLTQINAIVEDWARSIPAR